MDRTGWLSLSASTLGAALIALSAPIHHISAKAWLALIGSGVLCTAATTLLWNWGLTQVPASQAESSSTCNRCSAQFWVSSSLRRRWVPPPR